MKKNLIALTLILTSCGSPEFKVAYKYVPPKDNEKCLTQCKKEYDSCKSSCSRNYENCKEKAEEKASEVYAKLLKTYREELTAYNSAYDAYQRKLIEWNRNYRKLYKDYVYFKEQCKKHKHDYYVCERKYQLEEALDLLNDRKPEPPQKPKAPNFSSILSEFVSSCKKNCSCEELFRTCFVSCGGKAVPYRFCIKNCK